jgi:hypothetical protein
VTALVDYAELVTTVRELIDGTGRSVTFNRLGTTVADANKPWKPSGAAVTQAVYATFVPLSSLQELGLEFEDSELFRSASQACLVAPHASVDLSTYNTITDNGVEWRIEWVKVLKPGDTVLLLAFGVKR